MKKALNAWSLESALTMEEMFAAVSRAGFDGIELNVDSDNLSPHSLTLSTSKEEYASIRALSEKYSLPVVSISSSLWKGKMSSYDTHSEAEVVLHKQLEAAKELGADGILTVPGGMREGISLAAARQASIDFIKSQKAVIEESGIFVGVENVWNGFFLSPYDMASFIDEIGSPKVGAYLDVGNMIAFSVPEYWIEILGDRIGKVHVKGYKRSGGLNSGGEWTSITHGSADWQAIIPALRTAGYDGYLVGEVSKFDDSQSYMDYYKQVSDEIGSIIRY